MRGGAERRVTGRTGRTNEVVAKGYGGSTLEKINVGEDEYESLNDNVEGGEKTF